MTLSPDPSTRRRFMKRAAMATTALTASCVLTACGGSPEENGGGSGAGGDSATARGHVIGAGKFVAPEKTTCILSLVDLDASETSLRWFELPFFGHGVVGHPLDRKRAIVFEKKGPGACEVDLAERKVLRPITTKKSRHFYGHGAFSPDGSLLYCTESDLESAYAGVVAVRDGKTFELLGEFPSHGASPHDCVLVDSGKTMVITNAGGEFGGKVKPSVAYVDVEKQSLVEELTFTSPRISAGHLAISSKGDLVCVGAPRDGLPNKGEQPGQISMRTFGGRWRTMTDPAAVTSRMKAETLSVAIHEPTGKVLATNPAGNIATLWDLDAGKYITHHELEYPRGAAVTLDEEAFVVCYGKGGRGASIVRIDPRSNEIITGSTLANVGIGGSHLFPYDPPES